MFKYLFLLVVAVYFIVPVSNAEELKIVEFQGSKYLVSKDDNGEYIFKPIGVKPLSGPTVTKLKADIPVKKTVVEEQKKTQPTSTPTWKQVTKKESKVVSTCPDPVGCSIDVTTGECPSCKDIIVKEEIEETMVSDYDVFKNKILEQNRFEEKIKQENEKLPGYLQKWAHLRDSGNPLWACYKVYRTCRHASRIKISDLYLAYKIKHMCNTIDFKSLHGYDFDFNDPVTSCKYPKGLWVARNMIIEE